MGGGMSRGFSGGGGSSAMRSFSSPSMSRSFSGGSSLGSSMSRSFSGGSSLGSTTSRNFGGSSLGGSQSFSRSNSLGANSFSHSQNLGTSHWSNNISNWQSNHSSSTWQSARNTSTWQQHANDWHNGQNWANNNWSHNGNWNNGNWSHNNNWNNWSHNNNWWHGNNGWWWGHNGFWWYPVISIGASLWPWWGYDNYYPAYYDYYAMPYYGTADYAPLESTYVQPQAALPQAAQAPQVAEAPQQPATAADNGNAGAEFYADAVTAFRNGQYKDALRLANHAAVESPQNPKAHELMAMALFASNDYRGASAEAHAALAFGPPASWETVYGYYGNDKTYTDQLRALEKYSRDNPTAADARFVRAYQYLVTGHQPEAVDQLREVTKLAPQDRLAAELVKQLSGESSSAKPLLPPDPLTLPPPSGKEGAAPVDKNGVDT